MHLHPYLFCLSFYLLYFVLPPFEDNGLPFWVPDVLCQHSEVVLWNLLHIQMFFWWICGGESGLPILFLFHLRTTPQSLLLNMMSRFVIAFLPRRKHLLISWLQSPSIVILEPEKRKSVCFHFLPIYLPWNNGTRCMIIVFWMLSFKPAFSFLILLIWAVFFLNEFG